MGRDIHVNGQRFDPHDFQPVSMVPEYQEIRPNIPSMSISTLSKTTKSGILVPKDTVPDLLDRLLELQEPVRQERLAAEVRETEKKVITIPTRIFSLAA